MFEEEMPESDSSDEDFVPTGGGGSDVSEEDSDDAIAEEPDSEQINTSHTKRKKVKSSKVSRKKKKLDEEPPDEPELEVKPVENTEEKKKHADALWADFLKDCGPVSKKKPDLPPSNQSPSQIKPVERQVESTDQVESSTDGQSDRLKPEISNGSSCSESVKEESVNQSSSDQVVEVYEFAGEKVLVEKKVDPRKRVSRGGGVAALLSQINKKGKLSTLEKSKLDWEGFKDKEGINEQLSAHNRGKNGYLEKQDFLERTDLRQFEIEKQMREHSRAKRL